MKNAILVSWPAGKPAEREAKIMETFGTRLAALRKQRGMTQDSIAEKLNISAQAVSKWENEDSHS